MKRFLQWSGIAAGAVLVAMGVVALVMGVNGRSTVLSSIKQERIAGSPDMTPAAIAEGVAAVRKTQAELAAKYRAAKVPFDPTPVSVPGCSVAGKAVDTGDRARCFASYMRIHTLEASGGLTYSQMGRFVAKPGTPAAKTDFQGGTNDPLLAALDPKTNQPVSNGRRDLWVTYTALTTALNTSYMAQQLSLFGLVVGLTLVLSGLGFVVLAVSGAVSRVPRLRLAGGAQPSVG